MLLGFILHTISFSILQFGAIWLSLQKSTHVETLIQLSTNEILTSFFIAIFFIAIIFKLSHRLNLIKYLFYFIILIGTKSVFTTFYSNTISSILSFSILILYLSRKTIFLHNLILGTSLLGIATTLGVTLKPITIVLAMSVFSIYDIIAVYKSQHMLKLFKNFSNQGATLAFIYPKKLGKLTSNNLFILGTGDVAFPMLFVSALTNYSIELAVISAIGAIIGAMTVFYLLTIQKNKRAMPALPPIAICTILPVAIKLMISF
jgi:presenilin-like A22 family membrane protease